MQAEERLPENTALAQKSETGLLNGPEQSEIRKERVALHIQAI
jgi:hypothetical protein